MQLSFSTIFALLGAVQTAVACQVILVFENTKICHHTKPYRLLQATDGKKDDVCFTFGRPMPGVKCAHWDPLESPNPVGCVPTLTPNSISVGVNSTCWLWVTDDCKGKAATEKLGEGCKQPGFVYWQYKSFKCQTTGLK